MVGEGFGYRDVRCLRDARENIIRRTEMSKLSPSNKVLCCGFLLFFFFFLFSRSRLDASSGYINIGRELGALLLKPQQSLPEA